MTEKEIHVNINNERDLFEEYCKDSGLNYEFDQTVIGYESLETYKAYTIFKYSNNWRESK